MQRVYLFVAMGKNSHYHTEFPGLKGTLALWGEAGNRRLVIWVVPTEENDGFELKSAADRDEEC